MKLKTVCNNDVIIMERIIITVLRLKRPKKKKKKEKKDLMLKVVELITGII